MSFLEISISGEDNGWYTHWQRRQMLLPKHANHWVIQSAFPLLNWLKLNQINLVLIYKSAQVSIRFLRSLLATCGAGFTSKAPAEICAKESLSGRNSIQALGLLPTQLCCQVWSCPSCCHSQAAHAMSLPPCPLHVILFLWLVFRANKAPHIHPSGLRAPIPSLRFTASSAKHPRWGSFSGIPIWDFLERVLVLIQNPTQQSKGFPPYCPIRGLQLQPSVAATSSSRHGGAKKVVSHNRTPTCHHLSVSQWHFLLFPQISRVWIWDIGCKHNSQSKLRLHW